MPLNCPKRRKTTNPPHINKKAKKKRKKQTTFPSVKTVSQHLSKCVEENEELNLLKRIKIVTMRSKSHMAELPDEEQNKVKNEKQHNVKGKKQHKAKDEQSHKVKDEQQHKVKDEQQNKVKVEDTKQRNVKEKQQHKVKEEQQYKVKDKKQHKVVHEHWYKVKDEQQHLVKDKEQHKVIDEPRYKVKYKQPHNGKEEQQHKVLDETQHKVNYKQQHNIKGEQQDNIKNKEQYKIKDKKRHKVKEEQQHKVENQTFFEIRNIQIASLSATAEGIVEPTAGTVKRKEKKEISRRKSKYRILAKKFIKEYKYFCRLGELGTRRNTISYHTTLWWMRRAGICDNHRVTFHDVEVHFIHNLKNMLLSMHWSIPDIFIQEGCVLHQNKRMFPSTPFSYRRGYNLKILGFIRFLQSLCEDLTLRMSTVLNQMVSCRENNLIMGMTGRKPVKRSRLIYTTKSIMNAGRNQTASNVSKTGKKLEQKCAFSNESVVFCEKNPCRRERVKSASNALLYAKDYPTDLGVLRKWVNTSEETNPLQHKDDVLEDTKSSDNIYPNKKFSFEAELLRCTKRQKTIPKDKPKKLYASTGPCEIQGKLFKFTDKANEFISEEENYEYVESDSSCDKPCLSSEMICRDSQLGEKIEAQKNTSTSKRDNSRTSISKKKDLQLNPKENGDTSTDNEFQAHKCISIELIKLLKDELKNSSTFQNDQDVSEIFGNSEAQNASENSLIHSNKNENSSNDKCNAENNGDLFPESREKTYTLVSKKHEPNSPSHEKISFGQKIETRHSQKIEKSISSSDSKKSSLVKNRKLSPEVKITPTKNNFLTNCKRKLPPPPPPKILKNSNLLESQKEHKSISVTKNDTLRNKNLRNTQEAKLSSSCNKNNTPRSHGKLSIAKNSINSKKVDDNAPQDKDKNQCNENKKKVSNNKVPWNSGVIKFKSTQSKNNISPNYKRIVTSDDNNRKIASQKNDQRLSQKHKLPPSKNLKDTQGSEISAYRIKNNRTFKNQDANSQNNSKKTGTANSLTTNEVKIRRCNTRKPVEFSNKSKPPNNLEKVGKSNCPVKKEEKIKHCRTHKQDALINGLNIRKEAMNSHRDTKSEGISTRKSLSPRAEKSFNYGFKTKSISPKNTNTVEEESLSTVSSENSENSKTLEEEIPSVILSKNEKEAKHFSVVPPSKTKNVKVQEEISLIFSPKDIEDAETLEEKSSLTILSKSPEEAEIIEVEHDPVILPENIKEEKMLEEENSPIILPKDTENLKLLEEESFLIALSENTENRQINKEESLTTVSSKNTEEIHYEEERSSVIPPESTRTRKKENFPIISPKVAENAKISKEENSLFVLSEHTRNENTFEDKSHPFIPRNNTEEKEITEEECSPVIPSENSINVKMPKEEKLPIISSKYGEHTSRLQEKCFAIIPKSIREKKMFEEENSPVISLENAKCSQMLEEVNFSLKEARSECPPTESKKKTDKRRTFTNLSVRPVQRNSKGMKYEISEPKNLKTDKNKTPKEVTHKTQAFYDKRSTSSVNLCKISKHTDIACTKKVQQRHSADMSKATYRNNQDKTAESGAKTCKIQTKASLKTKTKT